MASLQARHQRSCDLGRPWTTFAEAIKSKGCTCTPLYHVVLRHAGKLVREPVGHNRKEAERALDTRRGEVARRTYRVLEDMPFNEWADRWIAGFTGKANSKRVYESTMAYAKDVFDKKKVRDLEAADVRRLLDHIRAQTATRCRTLDGEQVPREVAPATLAKHLRQLGACLEAAISEGYATENPVRRLHKTARPRVTKARPAYYTDAELARFWPELAERPVYSFLCKIAVATGLRFGELAALDWLDVDLPNRELFITRTFTEGIGMTSPKGGEPRTVDLTPQAAGLLEEWFGQAGPDGLVFQRDEGGHLSGNYVLKFVLYPALVRAGIPREGEHGRRRDFHSFRHTFARIALENGAPIDWLRRQLGHTSITLTVEIYGEWSRSAQKAAAERLDGAFTV